MAPNTIIGDTLMATLVATAVTLRWPRQDRTRKQFLDLTIANFEDNGVARNHGENIVVALAQVLRVACCGRASISRGLDLTFKEMTAATQNKIDRRVRCHATKYGPVHRE